MADKLNIFQRMSKITAELQTVAKNLEVGFGTNKYKAVGEADVLHAVKPIEEKYGVYSYPYSRDIEESDVFETTNSKGTVVQNKFMRVKTIYRFVNIDEPSDYIDITSYGDGVDPQDKTPGKAMTYADKYALLKAYKIQTGDDPDQNASQEGKFKGATSGKKAKPKAEPNADDMVLTMTRERIEAELEARGIPEEFVCGLYKCESLKNTPIGKLQNMAAHMVDIQNKYEEGKNE